jgi:hypothetical protein
MRNMRHLRDKSGAQSNELEKSGQFQLLYQVGNKKNEILHSPFHVMMMRLAHETS